MTGDCIYIRTDVKCEGQHLTNDGPALQDEVSVVIMKSPSTSWELNPLAINLPKNVLECLLPLISTIINRLGH